MTEVNCFVLDGHLTPASSVAASYARVWEMFWKQDQVAAADLELCRLTLARLHADQSEAAAINPFLAPGLVSDEKRKLVLSGKADASPVFSEKEKTLMLFAEYFWLDVASIPPEASAAARQFHTEAGHMIFCEALGLIDGRIRAACCLRDFSNHLNS